MILVVGPYPTKRNMKDGMVQRVAAIDDIISGHDRVYVYERPKKRGLSYFFKHPFKYLKNKKDVFYYLDDKVTVYENVLDATLSELFENSELVYIHSLCSAIRVPNELLLKYKNKIIVDLHGCVVEEAVFNNAAKEEVDYLQAVENLLFNNVKVFVSVSENMTDFYKGKYSGKNNEFIKLPIFMVSASFNREKDESGKPSVIYAGGLQKWQNPSLMFELVKNTYAKYRYIILVPKIKKLKRFLSEDALNNIFYSSVSPDEVPKYYEKSGFGLILRDDIIVNKVACPTKMIEYLAYGVIPVVLQPEIGDFNKLGYKYVTEKDLFKGNIPSGEEIQKMRNHNYKIVDILKEQTKSGKEKLSLTVNDILEKRKK